MKIERIQQPSIGANTERTVHKIEAQSKDVLEAGAVSLDADSKRRNKQQSSEKDENRENDSPDGDDTIAARISTGSTSRSLDVVV